MGLWHVFVLSLPLSLFVSLATINLICLSFYFLLTLDLFGSFICSLYHGPITPQVKKDSFYASAQIFLFTFADTCSQIISHIFFFDLLVFPFICSLYHGLIGPRVKIKSFMPGTCLGGMNLGRQELEISEIPPWELAEQLQWL